LWASHGGLATSPIAPDARFVGTSRGVNHDSAPLDPHARRLERKLFDIACDTRGDNGALEALFGAADRCAQSIPLDFNRTDFCTGADRDGGLFHGGANERRDFIVLHRQDALLHFHHGNLGTEGAVERREFHSDGTGTDHEQRFRQACGYQRFPVRPDPLGVDREARKQALDGVSSPTELARR
jgi:hypothetical protein